MRPRVAGSEKSVTLPRETASEKSERPRVAASRKSERPRACDDFGLTGSAPPLFYGVKKFLVAMSPGDALAREVTSDKSALAFFYWRRKIPDPPRETASRKSGGADGRSAPSALATISGGRWAANSRVENETPQAPLRSRTPAGQKGHPIGGCPVCPGHMGRDRCGTCPGLSLLSR